MSKLWHIATKEEIEDKLNTDFERGMTNEFAQSRLKQIKAVSKDIDKMQPKTAVSYFSTVMAILLCVLSVLFMLWGKPVFGTVLLVLVLASELLGFAIDIVSLKQKQKTKKLLLPKAVVIRDGIKKVLSADEITEGDIIVLTKGDIVPCDGRITYSENTEVDEFDVTGISDIVKKDENAEVKEDAEIKEQVNMLFKGSRIISGSCRMVACETGENTVYGKFLKETPASEENSYIKDKLSEVGKVLSALSVLLLVLLFVLCLVFGADMLESLAVCLTLGTVMVPSKMTSVVSYIVSRGMFKMSGGIVKNEAIAEKLALCDVVITGKSGIITKDESDVCGVFTTEGHFDLEDSSLSAAAKSILNIVLEFAAICTHSENDKNVSEEYAVDSAVLKAAKTKGLDTDGFDIVARYPFDMQRKLMSAVVSTGSDYRIITKGDLNCVLERCKYVVSSTSLDEMTEEKKENLLEKYKEVSEKGFKTIAVAYKDKEEILGQEDSETDLIFVGALVIENEIRAESVKAVRELIWAGIKPVVVTYDNARVAEHIAMQSGILREGSIVVTGSMLSEMKDEELLEKLENIAVFAELKPEDKERITGAFKRAGKTVCMIADSTYDKKASENAEISVSRKSGADTIAFDASVMTDGGLNDFVSTAKQAQKLYLDVRKALRMMVSFCIAQMLFVILGFALTKSFPLSAVQLLVCGILTVGLLPLAFPAGEAWENLKLKNIKAQNSIFSKMWTRIMAYGILSAVIAMIIFVSVKYFAPGMQEVAAYKAAQTAAFLFFALSALFNVIYLKISTFMLKHGKSELIETAAILGVYVLALILVLFIPKLKNILGFETKNILFVLLVSLVPAIATFLADLFKAIKEKKVKTEELNGTDI